MTSVTIIIIIFQLSSTTVVADRPSNAFTQSIYDLWCQENVRSNAWLLYPHRTPMGIQATQNETSLIYQLIDDRHSGLFSVHSKRLADFHFLLLNITRPLEINREYQDVYVLRVQAALTTPNQPTVFEQTEVRRSLLYSKPMDSRLDPSARC